MKTTTDPQWAWVDVVLSGSVGFIETSLWDLSEAHLDRCTENGTAPSKSWTDRLQTNGAIYSQITNDKNLGK